MFFGTFVSAFKSSLAINRKENTMKILHDRNIQKSSYLPDISVTLDTLAYESYRSVFSSCLVFCCGMPSV